RLFCILGGTGACPCLSPHCANRGKSCSVGSHGGVSRSGGTYSPEAQPHGSNVAERVGNASLEPGLSSGSRISAFVCRPHRCQHYWHPYSGAYVEVHAVQTGRNSLRVARGCLGNPANNCPASGNTLRKSEWHSFINSFWPGPGYPV